MAVRDVGTSGRGERPRDVPRLTVSLTSGYGRGLTMEVAAAEENTLSERWKNGSTRAWRTVRAAVLERDGQRCRIEVVGVCTTKATHVHHTQPREIVGDDPVYLVAACKECNLHIGAPDRKDPAPNPKNWWE